MPAYMPNIHCVKFYVFAYVNLYICYSAIVSMPVDMLSSVYLLMCQMLYPTCYVLYAKARMPVFVCWMPCASYCKFTVKSAYMPISVPVYACYIICRHMSAKYLLWDAKFAYMPVAVCLQLYAGTWVPSSSLWVAKSAYMSNCYISVYMPNDMGYMPNSIC
jgi:hypothetical protein